VKIIHTEKQRENLAKYFWDMSKVAFAVFVIGPFAKPESLSSTSSRYRYRIFTGSAGLSLGRNGGIEMNPFTVALIILGIIAAVGLFIVLFDKGLKKRS
jgi:hypothetical protein